MDARVAAAIGIMHESLSLNVSISSISKRVNLSPTRLRQLFHNDIGKSPMQHLGDLRMRHAEHLLRNTFLSIKEIAFACGVKHVSSFAHAFKRRHGMTPCEFRARILSING